MSKLIKEAITEYFGPQCPDYDKDCVCCNVWKDYDAITTAAQHMSGVKVKQLEWEPIIRGGTDQQAKCSLGKYVISVNSFQTGSTHYIWVAGQSDDEEHKYECETMAEAKAVAQADFEKRFWAMADVTAVEPSPAREQALDLSVLERLAKIADEYDEPDENGPFPDIQDAMISIRDLRQIRKLLAAIRALKSQPAQVEQWRIIETAPDNTKGPFLVTNNPKALDAFGRPSHVWCVNGIYKDENGSFCAYEGNQKIYGLTMFMQVPAPQTGDGE